MCDAGHELISGTICTACTDSEYGDGIICAQCSELDDKCTKCTDEDTCTACMEGFKPVGKVCVSEVCIVNNCVECVNDNGE